MLIVGARGFAQEVLEALLIENRYTKEIFFYDDVNKDVSGLLFGTFKILKNMEEVNALLGNRFRFTIGIGGPLLRSNLKEKFERNGGELVSVISQLAKIGSFDNEIGIGANIMAGSIITNSVRIGKASLVNLNCTIGHDCEIGDFLEMSPGSHISGNCKIGNFVNIGTNATILPKITVGNNVIIGANSVITKNIPDNCLVVGVPAKVVKELDPLDL